MKAITRIIFLDENNDKFFGEGPYRLLKGLEETGSLHSAAKAMGMAYTKALKLVKHAEAALQIKLTTTKIGGASGGGSTLTNEGKDWMNKYESYRNACLEANQKLYQEFFPES